MTATQLEVERGKSPPNILWLLHWTHGSDGLLIRRQSSQAVAEGRAALYNPRRSKSGLLIFPTARLLCPALDVFVSQPRPLVDRSQAVLLLKWQALFAVVLASLALIKGLGAAIAVGLGAGIAVVGSVYFALQAFRHAGARQAPQIVRSFYKGEAGKLVITVLLFAAVFVGVKPLQVGWLLTGFILEQLVVWGFVFSVSTKSKQ